MRKKYDAYGEDALNNPHNNMNNNNNNNGNNYQSWNFYQQNFGIYDDDPEIQTLTRAEFSKYVVFFSP